MNFPLVLELSKQADGEGKGGIGGELLKQGWRGPPFPPGHETVKKRAFILLNQSVEKPAYLVIQSDALLCLFITLRSGFLALDRFQAASGSHVANMYATGGKFHRVHALSTFINSSIELELQLFWHVPVCDWNYNTQGLFASVNDHVNLTQFVINACETLSMVSELVRN